ncbi:CLUMA_CG010947, isoform A [Clunio marinus]|uniref:CLUMA_CG010947, isoform A n=1 Tax=Clunio marinus TaxID=568069 RepID=A0A1J1IGI2_9DIPT|nr:CLUMA_CG010947, isoform A [Clunio marinus]
MNEDRSELKQQQDSYNTNVNVENRLLVQKTTKNTWTKAKKSQQMVELFVQVTMCMYVDQEAQKENFSSLFYAICQPQ